MNLRSLQIEHLLKFVSLFYSIFCPITALLFLGFYYPLAPCCLFLIMPAYLMQGSFGLV